MFAGERRSSVLSRRHTKTFKDVLGPLSFFHSLATSSAPWQGNELLLSSSSRDCNASNLYNRSAGCNYAKRYTAHRQLNETKSDGRSRERDKLEMQGIQKIRLVLRKQLSNLQVCYVLLVTSSCMMLTDCLICHLIIIIISIIIILLRDREAHATMPGNVSFIYVYLIIIYSNL